MEDVPKITETGPATVPLQLSSPISSVRVTMPTLSQSPTSGLLDTVPSTALPRPLSSLGSPKGGDPSSVAQLMPTLFPFSPLQSMFANYCLNLSHIRQLQSLMDPSSSLSPIQTIEASVAEEEDRGSETPVAYLKERVRQNSELSADRPDSKKKKGARRTFTDEQVAKLENYFDYKRYFTPVERTKIAKELLLSETQIKTWFQNRRAKNKRDENERREQEQLRFRQLAARAKLITLGSQYPYPTSLVPRFQER
ncbi:hypothetical protein ACHWQZ_G017653 [Mnemiopsis leidyi]